MQLIGWSFIIIINNLLVIGGDDSHMLWSDSWTFTLEQLAHIVENLHDFKSVKPAGRFAFSLLLSINTVEYQRETFGGQSLQENPAWIMM